MFREMRRRKQALSPESCVEVLRKGTSGVLAVSGDDGYPYAVPLSYVYDDGRLFFHCAPSGHKQLFYWFYPAHVYLLYGASCLLYNVLR